MQSSVTVELNRMFMRIELLLGTVFAASGHPVGWDRNHGIEVVFIVKCFEESVLTERSIDYLIFACPRLPSVAGDSRTGSFSAVSGAAAGRRAKYNPEDLLRRQALFWYSVAIVKVRKSDYDEGLDIEIDIVQPLWRA